MEWHKLKFLIRVRISSSAYIWFGLMKRQGGWGRNDDLLTTVHYKCFQKTMKVSIFIFCPFLHRAGRCGVYCRTIFPKNTNCSQLAVGWIQMDFHKYYSRSGIRRCCGEPAISHDSHHVSLVQWTNLFASCHKGHGFKSPGGT